MKWLLLLAGILANASASVLVKFASGHAIVPTRPLAPGNVRFAAAICLYFIAFLLYSAAVARLPLAVAHPITTAGAILLVGLSAVTIFGERFTPLQTIGYALLFCGIGCIAMSREHIG